jgi:hypothetical protein
VCAGESVWTSGPHCGVLDDISLASTRRLLFPQEGLCGVWQQGALMRPLFPQTLLAPRTAGNSMLQKHSTSVRFRMLDRNQDCKLWSLQFTKFMPKKTLSSESLMTPRRPVVTLAMQFV